MTDTNFLNVYDNENKDPILLISSATNNGMTLVKLDQDLPIVRLKLFNKKQKIEIRLEGKNLAIRYPGNEKVLRLDKDDLTDIVFKVITKNGTLATY